MIINKRCPICFKPVPQVVELDGTRYAITYSVNNSTVPIEPCAGHTKDDTCFASAGKRSRVPQVFYDAFSEDAP